MFAVTGRVSEKRDSACAALGAACASEDVVAGGGDAENEGGAEIDGGKSFEFDALLCGVPSAGEAF